MEQKCGNCKFKQEGFCTANPARWIYHHGYRVVDKDDATKSKYEEANIIQTDPPAPEDRNGCRFWANKVK